MSGSAPSVALTRTQTALFVAAFAAGAVSLSLVLRYQDFARAPPTQRLSRSNAVYRRRQRDPGNANEPAEDVATTTPPGGTNAEHHSNAIRADDAVTDLGMPENDPDDDAESQKLHELMFAISKNRARNEGFIHRGITCDSCGKQPIVGVRYRCANCPDFDLCEDCEAQDDRHPKTHIFYKIKIPAPWAGKAPERPWYPGRPYYMPKELSGETRAHLHHRTNQDSEKLDAFYAQFSCIASVEWPQDPLQIGMAVNWDNFCACFVPQAKENGRINYVFARIFALFDSDSNGLIGFEEFVIGLTTVLDREQRDNQTCVFNALDHNQDGYISRQNCLDFFHAYFELDKDILWDHYRMTLCGQQVEEVESRESALDRINGGRSIAVYFDSSLGLADAANNAGSGKRADASGELMPQEGHESLIAEPVDLFTQQSIHAGDWSHLNSATVLQSSVPDWEQEMLRLYARREPRYIQLEGSKPDVFIEDREEAVEKYAHRSLNGTTYLFVDCKNTGEAPNPLRCLFIAVPPSYGAEAIQNPGEKFVWAVTVSRFILDRKIHKLNEDQARRKMIWRQRQSVLVLASKSSGRAEGALGVDARNAMAADGLPVNAEQVRERLAMGPEAISDRNIEFLLEEGLQEMLDLVFIDAERTSAAILASVTARHKYRAEIAIVLRAYEQKRKAHHEQQSNTATPPSSVEALSMDQGEGLWALVLQARRERASSPEDVFRDVTHADLQFERDYRRVDLNYDAPNTPAWPERESSAKDHKMPAYDPTMPQNMASSDGSTGDDQVLLRKEDMRVRRFMNMMIQLTRLEDVASKLPAPARDDGAINFETWKEKLKAMKEDGKQLLRWTSGWLDVSSLVLLG